jgi:crotonobetainyl-CoA:carnitine CoA-transferase CaiB-like acyl-CoA transferase
MKLLAGVRVLDVSGLIPGPYASLLLADLGADVIKVESRLGDLLRQVPPLVAQRSAYFLSLNRNKRSLGLDLKKAAGRDLFLDLARQCDVVIEGFRPGRAERLGIGFEALRRVNPRLVYCSISGFGQTGPDAGRAGHDLTYLARSGILGLTGTADGVPVIPPVQLADLTAGTTAALAICGALFARERSGEGSYLDISMLESVAAWMSIHLEAHRAGATAERGAMPLTGRYPFYSVYRTADGGHVALGALEPLFWRDFCRAVGRPDLAGLQLAQGAERERVFKELAAIFAGRSRQEWVELIRANDLAAEPVADLEEVLADPQLYARGAILVLVHPEEGELVQVGCPIQGEPASPPELRLPPDLGADTRQVLAEILDLEEETIDNLIAARVVFGPEEADPRLIAPQELP